MILLKRLKNGQVLYKIKQTYQKIGFLLLYICCISFYQCGLINPEEAIPAFIQLEPFVLQTDALTQGSASHKITEAWLTVNDEFLGVYQLPATVPVLVEGLANVLVEAGIKDNGIGSTPEIYPFYTPYETQIELLPNQTYIVNPSTTYDQNTRFAVLEDFESGTTAFRDTLLGNGGMQVSTIEAFEGDFSGKIILSQDDPIIELATVFDYSELTSRSPFVYLEINYRSEVPVIFGLLGGGGTANQNVVFEPGFNPKDSWNKIYFNLSGLLATSPFDAHQIALRAFIPTDNGQLTLNNASVCLDNIKLVHF